MAALLCLPKVANVTASLSFQARCTLAQLLAAEMVPEMPEMSSAAAEARGPPESAAAPQPAESAAGLQQEVAVAGVQAEYQVEYFATLEVAVRRQHVVSRPRRSSMSPATRPRQSVSSRPRDSVTPPPRPACTRLDMFTCTKGAPYLHRAGNLPKFKSSKSRQSSCCGGGAAPPSSCSPLAASARASHAALSSLARLAHTRRTHTCLPACLAGWLATRYARNTRTVTRVTFWIRVRPAYRMHRMHTHVP